MLGQLTFTSKSTHQSSFHLRDWFMSLRESFGGIILFVLFFGLFFLLFNADYALLTKRMYAFSDPNGFLKAERVPQTWLDRYSIVISSDSDFDSDQDNDGLTLQQEYIYLTNPINPDTDADGVMDGKEVEEGNNPRGLGVMDVDGDGLPDKWERENGLDPVRNDADLDADGDQLSNRQEFVHGTHPKNPDTDGDTFQDGVEVQNGYDPSAPGDAKPETTIVISKIDVTIPMVWSQSIAEVQLQYDLTKGAIHYPRTAAPGQGGNMFIAAHSSNYAWVEGNYNYAFSKLNNVEPGDTITVTTTQANGAVIDYVYKTVEQRIVQPDDPWIFHKTESPTATFSTCWPLGTRQKRLIVKAELVQ